ncbi:MAG: glycosyltransferase family 4 protein [Deltaproteobacteria bacterium]|nr:glycosyltransferase family 4 protein [Deltaproteobacteria bacterium]
MATLSFYSYDHVGNPWCGGGGALRHLEVLRRFRPAWERITVYVGDYPGFVPHEVEGVRFESLGGGRSEAASRVLFTLHANLRVLLDGADVLGNDVSTYAPLLAGLLRPGRFFGIVHHRVGRRYLERFGAAGRIPWAVERLLWAGLRNVVTVNRAVGDAMREVNPRARVFDSANGFDPALLDLASTVAELPYLLFVGRLDPFMKGLDVLLEAFAAVAPGHPSLRLVLAGRGTPADVDELLRRSEAAGVAGRVEVRPNVGEEEKRRLLSGCVLFCSPSRFEGFGIAALEANAAGKAVLATDTDGFRESLAPDGTALLVPPGDAVALGRALERLLGEPGLRRRLEAAARPWARRFAWDAVAEREQWWVQATFELASRISARHTTEPRSKAQPAGRL